MTMKGFEESIQKYHHTIEEFATGNAKPIIEMLSSQATLAGGFGGFTRGKDNVAKSIEFAATQFSEGKMEFEGLSRVETKEMAYIVEMETYKSKLSGSPDISRDVLRVTSIFRYEEGTWKLIHRHGDPVSAMMALIQMIPRAVVSIRPANE